MGNELQHQLAQEYWLGKIRDFEQATHFRPSREEVERHSIELELDIDLFQSLKKVSGGNSLSEYIIALATLTTLLAKYDYTKQFIASADFLPVRSEADTGPVFFSFSVEESHTFGDVVELVKAQFKEVINYRHYDFRKLKEIIEVNKLCHHEDLFSFGIGISPHNGAELSDTQSFKLLFVLCSGDRGVLQIYYSSAACSGAFARQAGLHFLRIMGNFLQYSSQALNAFPLLSERERSSLLHQNTVYLQTGKEETVIEMFEKAVMQDPGRTAVVCNGRILTYGELNGKANQLAHCLRNKCRIGKGQLIGISTARSEQLIVGIIGILKTGGAYLPLDTAYPAARLKYMLSDAGIDIIVRDEKTCLPDGFRGLALSIDSMAAFSSDNIGMEINGSDLAYVLYTSGSTGGPKGVMMEHAGIVNLIRGLKAALNIDNCLRHSLTSAVSFDASVKQIFIPLCSGGELHILTDMQNVKEVVQYLNKKKINVVHLSPALWKASLEEMRMAGSWENLKCISSGGDELSPALVEELRNTFKEQQLFNTYGPTETCVNALCYDITSSVSRPVPIGVPLPGYSVCILGKHKELLPAEVPGEIWIGGTGLARGYLNEPELTNERFMEHPYIPGAKLYRTGDLGLRLSDGNVVFLGRTDAQVKIRGYRIELAEIEAAARAHKLIDEAKALAIGNEGYEKQIVIFYKAQEALHYSGLKTFLQDRLPEFMIPALFKQLTAFPLTSGGKIDIRQLHVINGFDNTRESEYVAPHSDTGRRLEVLWKAVLKIDGPIGINTSFFELGGHSLRAVRLLSLLYRELDVNIDIKTFYEHPTIAGLSVIVDEARKTAYEVIPPVGENEHYELSHAQKRLWILNHFDGEKLAYLIPGGIILEGKLDIDMLDKAFMRLIERHENLRTVFFKVNEEPRQRIKEAACIQFRLERMNIRDLPEEDKIHTIGEFADREISAPFNLEEGPLLRAKLLLLEKEKHILLFSMHHIISDGWSMGNLVRELSALYNSFLEKENDPLPALAIHYKDYAAWQHKLLNNGALQYHRAYWLDKLKGPLPKIELPYDFERPVVKTSRGITRNFVLNEELTNSLGEFGRQGHVSLFTVLLALTKILFFRYTGQEDIIIGSPVAAREHPDLHDQIGFYVNTVALRDRIREDESFPEVLERVNQTVFEAMKYQSYPFDLLVDELDIKKDRSRSSVFDVMLIVQNNEETEVNMKGLRVSDFKINPASSKFDLLLCFTQKKQAVFFDLEYNTDLFTASRADLFFEELKALIRCIVRSPNASIGSLSFFRETGKLTI